MYFRVVSLVLCVCILLMYPFHPLMYRISHVSIGITLHLLVGGLDRVLSRNPARKLDRGMARDDAHAMRAG